MKTFTKVLFASVLAALLMSMAAGSASALRSISLNNGGQKVFTYGGTYTFGEPRGGFNVICEVLRVITFTREVIPKTERTLIGSARLSLRNCRGGTVVLLNPEAWNVRYIGFTGSLPNPEQLIIQIDPEATRGGFLLEVFFGAARCLYGRAINGRAVNTGGEIRSIIAEEAPNRVTTNLGGATCPEGILRGTLVPLPESQTIRIRLV